MVLMVAVVVEHLVVLVVHVEKELLFLYGYYQPEV
jgi:hypothetical protein